jgi:hypothetical protein
MELDYNREGRQEIVKEAKESDRFIMLPLESKSCQPLHRLRGINLRGT